MLAVEAPNKLVTAAVNALGEGAELDAVRKVIIHDQTLTGTPSLSSTDCGPASQTPVG
jgi:hypothetical protein